MKQSSIATLAPYLQQEKILYLLMIGFSIVLSLIEIQDSVINRDAIVYLSTAEEFLDHGFSGDFKAYSWLAYAVLGATLSKATHLSLENCFYIINTILYAVIPVIFLRIYVIATNSRNTLLVAALLILLLPAFNNYRDMIIRDVGFWCFSLLALLAFLRFTRTQKIFYAACWQLAIGAALLFRLEALAWIIAMPFCLFWLDSGPFVERCKHWLLSICAYALIFIVIGIFLWANNTALDILQNKIPTATTVFNGLDSLIRAKEQMVIHVLNEESEKHAFLVLISGLLALVIYIVLSTIGFIYISLSVAAFFKRYTLRKNVENRVIFWALTITLSTLIVFSLSSQFLIERYAILAALLILLLISQPITLWATNAWPNSRLRVKYGFFCLAAAVLLDTLISTNPAPTNLKLAGKWLQDNVSFETPIALNDNRLLHYSGRLKKGITCVIDKDLSISLKSIDSLRPYTYIVTQAKKETQQEVLAPLSKDKSFEKITEFSRGKSVITIFKNIQPSAAIAADCNPFR